MPRSPISSFLAPSVLSVVIYLMARFRPAWSISPWSSPKKKTSSIYSISNIRRILLAQLTRLAFIILLAKKFIAMPCDESKYENDIKDSCLLDFQRVTKEGGIRDDKWAVLQILLKTTTTTPWYIFELDTLRLEDQMVAVLKMRE